jgi:hypothetical protein
MESARVHSNGLIITQISFEPVIDVDALELAVFELLEDARIMEILSHVAFVAVDCALWSSFIVGYQEAMLLEPV